MRKYVLPLTLTLFLLLGGLFSSTVADDEPQLTAEEALEIALSHPEVEEWLKSYEFETEEPYYANGSWVVVFTLKSDTRKELVVYIDDETGEVTEIHTFEFDDNPSYGDKYVDEAIAYANNLELLAGFIESYPHLQWSGYGYDNLVDLYASSEYNDSYIWMSLQLEMFGNETDKQFELVSVSANAMFGFPQNTFEQIANLISDHPEVQEFVDKHPEHFVNFQLHYRQEGQEYMYEIYYQSEGGYEDGTYETIWAPSDSLCYCGYYTWLRLVVNDASGEVIEAFGTYTASHTVSEMVGLIKEHPELGPWLESLEEYKINARFDGYDMWWIDVWSTTSKDYAYVSINDTTAVMVDYYLFIPIPATKTAAQIESLATRHSEIAEWIEKVEDYHINAYYDDRGTWYVSLRHPVLYQNYAYATVDDVTGKVSDVQTFIIEANLSLEDIYNILRSADLGDFLDTFPDAIVYMYYADSWWDYDERGEDTNSTEPQKSKKWHVNIVSPTIIEARIELIIDDNTGEIVHREEQRPKIMPQHDADEVMELVSEIDEVVAFKNNHTIEYEYTFYYNGSWMVWMGGEDPSGLWGYISVTVEDKTFEVISVDINIYSWFYRGTVLDEGAYQEARNDALGPQMNTQEGAPLSEILEDNGPFLNVPGFALFLAMISLSLLVVVGRQR